MRVTVKLKDHSDELSVLGVHIPDLNLVDSLWADADALADGLAAEIAAMTIGTIQSVRASQATQAEDKTRPANAFAQRETGFRVFFTDNVNQEAGYFTIGTADLGIASVVPGQDELDLSVAPASSLVTWLETNAVTRDGNALTVDRIVIVGRNN